MSKYASESLNEISKIVEARVELALKSGFYAGQAMAGVELEDCHKNWKKWDLPKTNGSKSKEAK